MAPTLFTPLQIHGLPSLDNSSLTLMLIWIWPYDLLLACNTRKCYRKRDFESMSMLGLALSGCLEPHPPPSALWESAQASQLHNWKYWPSFLVAPFISQPKPDTWPFHQVLKATDTWTSPTKASGSSTLQSLAPIFQPTYTSDSFKLSLGMLYISTIENW